MSETKPITPAKASQEARKLRGDIPPQMFEAFNTLIVKYLRNGTAKFSIDAVANEARRLGIDLDTAESNKWFDVETYYEKVGWSVEFRDTGWNSPEPDWFIFLIPYYHEFSS